MKVLENDDLLKFTFFLIIYLVNILLKKVYLLIASLSFRQNQEPHILNKSIFEGAYQLLLKIWYLIFLFLVFLICRYPSRRNERTATGQRSSQRIRQESSSRHAKQHVTSAQRDVWSGSFADYWCSKYRFEESHFIKHPAGDLSFWLALNVLKYFTLSGRGKKS